MTYQFSEQTKARIRRLMDEGARQSEEEPMTNETRHTPGRPWTRFDFEGGAPPLPLEDTIEPARLDRIRKAAPEMETLLRDLRERLPHTYECFQATTLTAAECSCEVAHIDRILTSIDQEKP